jgi:hypothetical protein
MSTPPSDHKIQLLTVLVLGIVLGSVIMFFVYVGGGGGGGTARPGPQDLTSPRADVTPLPPDNPARRGGAPAGQPPARRGAAPAEPLLGFIRQDYDNRVDKLDKLLQTKTPAAVAEAAQEMALWLASAPELAAVALGGTVGTRLVKDNRSRDGQAARPRSRRAPWA